MRFPRTYRIPKFVAGFFGLDSVLLTDGSFVDPCDIGNIANNCRRFPDCRISRVLHMLSMSLTRESAVMTYVNLMNELGFEDRR